MSIQYQSCTLCPRKCRVNRSAGERGFCESGSLRIARAARHMWEEPVISGVNGSGTIFFSGCTLHCSFCQNRTISSGGFGEEISSERLREIFLELIEEGAHNINLVTPTHFLPDILPALQPKLPVPVIYNCGGYESVDTLRELEGFIDIYLPDYKYSDAKLAASLSSAPDYPTVALTAIREMVRQTGPVQLQNGIATRGTIVRHLILPGYLDNSLGAIETIASIPNVQLSLMQQYTPMPGSLPPLDRTVTDPEADAALSWAWLCGIQNGYYQDAESADVKYIPDFSLQGVDKST